MTASSADLELAVRKTGSFLYVIALRRGGGTTRVTLRGLPAVDRGGQVLFEYVQDPPPPPIDPTQPEVPLARGRPAARSRTGSLRTTCTCTASPLG